MHEKEELFVTTYANITVVHDVPPELCVPQLLRKPIHLQIFGPSVFNVERFVIATITGVVLHQLTTLVIATLTNNVVLQQPTIRPIDAAGGYNLLLLLQQP